jgi:hypothetical protein
MNRLTQYIKVAHNSFMTRGTAILKGLVSVADNRTDLTIAAPAAARPVLESPVIETQSTPETAAAVPNVPLTAAQVAEQLDEIYATTDHARLSPEKQEALISGGLRTLEAARSYELASGRTVLPTTQAKSADQRLRELAAASPELERVLTNCGRIKARMSPELKRIIGNSNPSLLSPADRQSMMPPKVVEIIENYQRASGYAVLPIDRAKSERKPP